MTEQEQKAIKWMKNVRDDAVVTLDHIAKEEPNVSPMLYAGRKEKAETIINGFEELGQYRAIGTVSELQDLVIGINALADSQFSAADMAKLVNDMKSLYEYRQIGTPEECRSAVEKQKELKATDTYGFVAIGKTVEQFEQEIRNKAIDDFAESCKQDIMCQTFGLKPRNIDEIAEQLKVGD